MAIVTHFMATSASGKRLALQDLETLAAHLLREGWVRFPAAILVGGVAYEPRYTDKETDGESSWEGFTNFSRWVAPHFIVPNDPTTMVSNLAQKRCAADLVWYDGADEQPILRPCTASRFRNKMSACVSRTSMRACESNDGKGPWSMLSLDQL